MNEIITRAEALVLAVEIEAETRYRLQLAREAYERGRGDGWHEGREDAHREMERAWQQVARPIARGGIAIEEIEERRWGPAGRGHFGDPRPGDQMPAEMLAAARASWEPLGLPEPGMVHLSGPVVHYHQCSANCPAYRPGWYTIAEAIAILRTLPGDYAGNIAGLERKGASLERRAA